MAALDDPRFAVFGVTILNVTKARGIALLENVFRQGGGRAHGVFFVNAHVLNLAYRDPAYRAVLGGGDFVFADGTGVRWAARRQGVRLLDNLVGTDFVPALFTETAGRGYSYFLLGSDEPTVRKAAFYAEKQFPGWKMAGFHHGYLQEPEVNAVAIGLINAVRPNVLLVGMGNPLQERWITKHLPRLRVPVCLAIGGLFDYWADNVSRAPRWLRRAGHEWMWRLYQQPFDKAKRYLIGNPLFLWRILLHGRQQKVK
ncbi:MAG: WecB/TagA/CpsF family glycosyltransferase [Pirellulales bacterium]|nr:WecB/TagA/CpsF family glycosyltransferase [Pirellulales bacterium]